MKIFFSFALSLLSLQAFSQSDSTDLNLYTEPYIFENEIDSMLLSDGNYKILFLELLINDFNSVYNVLVDVNYQGEIFPIIRIYNKVTEFELINENTIKIKLGLIETSHIYEVNVTLFDITGISSPTIIKIFSYEN